MWHQINLSLISILSIFAIILSISHGVTSMPMVEVEEPLPVWTMVHALEPSTSYDVPEGNTNVMAHPSRRKRYVLRKKRWSKHLLRWRLKKKWITEADEFIVRNTLHRAFNNWASVSSIRFVEIADEHAEVDVEVAFEKGIHADSFPFDGPDGVVAHAFYPQDGRLHFDADEQWTLNQPDGVNLYQTAVHEIGHLLGLEHSTDPRAAMYGAKRPYDAEFQLADDDVRAIRSLFPLRKKIKHSLIRLPMHGDGEGAFDVTQTFPTTPTTSSDTEQLVAHDMFPDVAPATTEQDLGPRTQVPTTPPSVANDDVDFGQNNAERSTLWPHFLGPPRSPVTASSSTSTGVDRSSTKDVVTSGAEADKASTKEQSEAQNSARLNENPEAYLNRRKSLRISNLRRHPISPSLPYNTQVKIRNNNTETVTIEGTAALQGGGTVTPEPEPANVRSRQSDLGYTAAQRSVSQEEPDGTTPFEETSMTLGTSTTTTPKLSSIEANDPKSTISSLKTASSKSKYSLIAVMSETSSRNSETDIVDSTTLATLSPDERTSDTTKPLQAINQPTLKYSEESPLLKPHKRKRITVPKIEKTVGFHAPVDPFYVFKAGKDTAMARLRAHRLRTLGYNTMHTRDPVKLRLLDGLEPFI